MPFANVSLYYPARFERADIVGWSLRISDSKEPLPASIVSRKRFLKNPLSTCPIVLTQSRQCHLHDCQTSSRKMMKLHFHKSLRILEASLGRRYATQRVSTKCIKGAGDVGHPRGQPPTLSNPPVVDIAKIPHSQPPIR